MSLESLKRNYNDGLITRNEATTYQVVDTQNGSVMGHYVTAVKAARRGNKLDLQYGAVRYTVRPVRPD